MLLVGVLLLLLGVAVWRRHAQRVVAANTGMPIPYLRRPPVAPRHTYWFNAVAVFTTIMGARLIGDRFPGSLDYSVTAAAFLVVLAVVATPIVRHNQRLAG